MLRISGVPDEIREKGSLRTAFILLSLEAVFGGFYLSVSRAVTPIFFVSQVGLGLKELMAFNAVAGGIALTVSGILYGFLKRKEAGVKWRLVTALFVERLMWFLIPVMAWGEVPLALTYGLAIAASVPSGIFLYSVFLTFFEERVYRKLIAFRTMGSSAASIIGQLTVLTVLAFGSGSMKYWLLYLIAFSVSLVSILLVLLSPLSGVRIRRPSSVEEESDVEAVNTFLLLMLLLTGANLLSISWVPRLIKGLGSPDYFPALISFTQTLTAIGASLFWSGRSLRAHRYAILLLALTPPLVYGIYVPEAHVGIAALYSFSFIGANLYVSAAYSRVVKGLGVLKASTLLTSGNSAALLIGSLLGYALSYSEVAVFAAASATVASALAIALTTVQELAVVPKHYSKLYSKILYTSSLAGYNFIVITAEKTAKTTLRVTALLITLGILFIIYRTLYYIILLSRGGG